MRARTGKTEFVTMSMISWLTRLLTMQFPFFDISTPIQPPAHLRHDLGLTKDDEAARWRDWR